MGGGLRPQPAVPEALCLDIAQVGFAIGPELGPALGIELVQPQCALGARTAAGAVQGTEDARIAAQVFEAAEVDPAQALAIEAILVAGDRRAEPIAAHGQMRLERILCVLLARIEGVVEASIEARRSGNRGIRLETGPGIGMPVQRKAEVLVEHRKQASGRKQQGDVPGTPTATATRAWPAVEQPFDDRFRLRHGLDQALAQARPLGRTDIADRVADRAREFAQQIAVHVPVLFLDRVVEQDDRSRRADTCARSWPANRAAGATGPADRRPGCTPRAGCAARASGLRSRRLM